MSAVSKKSNPVFSSDISEANGHSPPAQDPAHVTAEPPVVPLAEEVQPSGVPTAEVVMPVSKPSDPTVRGPVANGPVSGVPSSDVNAGKATRLGRSTLKPQTIGQTISPPAYSGNTYSEGDYRWNRGTYSRPQRFIDIWSFVIKLLSKRWLYNKAWTYGGPITPEKQTKRRKEIAVWLRETCLSLGPTFIKIGQLFSTRADLFPIEYVEELSKLQDRVPAFSYEQVKETIENDFGRPLDELYQSFDPVPIAAASLGQVLCAELHSGEEVVVKI